MGLDHGVSPTRWPWHTREGRQGPWGQLTARRRHTDGRAVTFLLPPFHLSIGRHEIATAWRGRLGKSLATEKKTC